MQKKKPLALNSRLSSHEDNDSMPGMPGVDVEVENMKDLDADEEELGIDE